MKGTWYLAAPFFNPAQVALVAKIEELFKMYEVPLFSPRQHPANKKAGPITDVEARDIFDRNWQEILNCSDMLAVVDWLMPENQELYILQDPNKQTYHPIPGGDRKQDIIMMGGKRIAGPLNLPDTGTVWEMGAAHAAGTVDVFMFTTRPEEQGLNIMLSQGARGVLRGLEELEKFLAGGCDREAVKRWTGRNI